MTEQVKNPAVEFASMIAELATTEAIDFGTVFNGLAIASAAFLVDYTLSLDGVVQEDELQEAKEKFKDGIDKAVLFAASQVPDLKVGGTD